METGKELPPQIKNKRNLETGAKVSLIVILFSVVRQLAGVFQTRYQLVSPLIPESYIWQITKQSIFIALISVLVSIVGLIFYFYRRYLWVIILIILTLLTERFIYI
jgi:hypothetical protein